MDDLYLIKHLKKLSELLYEGTPFAFKDPHGQFVFGTKENQNTVTKRIAIYLSIGLKINEKDTDKKIKRTRSF